MSTLELDVRRTKSGEIVVFHDEDVKRTTDGKSLVSELTLEQIKSLNTKKEGKIPTLEEALDFIDKKVKMFIELKEPGIEEQVLSLLKKKHQERGFSQLSAGCAEENSRIGRQSGDRLNLR